MLTNALLIICSGHTSDKIKNVCLHVNWQSTYRKKEFASSYLGKMSVITLNLNGEKEILIMEEHLIKVPESKLAKYFFGDQKACEDLSPWIIKAQCSVL